MQAIVNQKALCGFNSLTITFSGLLQVVKGKGKNKVSPGQMSLAWDDWEVTDSEVWEVAEKFVRANAMTL